MGISKYVNIRFEEKKTQNNNNFQEKITQET